MNNERDENMLLRKKYSISYNPDYYIAVANDIIWGKQTYTDLNTTRLIRLLISQIVKEDKDLKTYKCKITDFASYFGIDPSNIYEETQKLCKNAMQAEIYVGTGNAKDKWELFHWIETCKYDGNGTLIVKLSEGIKPYVIELEKYYLQYKGYNSKDFKSFYSYRLYEMLKSQFCYHNENVYEIEFTIQRLRECFDCENKLASTGDFKKRTIDKALVDINSYTDLLVSARPIKTGRKITSISFYIRHNTAKSRQAYVDGKFIFDKNGEMLFLLSDKEQTDQ